MIPSRSTTLAACSLSARSGLVGPAVLLALLAALGGCEREAKAEAPHPPAGEAWLTPQQLLAGQIAAQPLEERELGAAITTSGKVAFDDQRVAHVFSPVSGRIVDIRVRLGQKVRKGQTLAVIDSPDLGQAVSDLDKAEADLVQAEHELKRQQELVAAQAGAQRDLEQAQDNRRKAKSEVERAGARLRLLHGGGGHGERFALRAPIAGEVMARSVNPGAEVQGQYAGGNSELFTIGSIDQVWIWADVFESDLAAVHEGAALAANVPAYPNRDFTGRVDWVSPSLDPQSRTARVRCVLPNKARELRPEMYATVHLATGAHRVLAVPRSAVIRQGEQTVVFVQSGRTDSGLSKFQRRVVRVDESASGELLPVLSGLQRGETVVISGGLQLTGLT